MIIRKKIEKLTEEERQNILKTAANGKSYIIEYEEETLTQTEKEYLTSMLVFFRNFYISFKNVVFRKEERCGEGSILIMFDYRFNDGKEECHYGVHLLPFPQGKLFRGMIRDKNYSLADLGIELIIEEEE